MTATPFVQTAATSTDWRDRLVELHVLAEHGCTESATSAQDWLAADPAAHEAWHAVEQTCRALRDDRAV